MDQKELLQASVSDFTEMLASKTSVPGGGGASALAAAIGIALGDMVGEFTVGKKKYAAVEADVKNLMEQAQQLRMEFLACIEKDAESFEPLSKAYGIPKDDPNRDVVMEKCLADAAAVPMELMRLCAKAIDILAEFAAKGSVIVISDAATGAAIVRGALQGAAVNVKINTSSMKNRTLAEALNQEADGLLEEYVPKADAIFAKIYARYN